MMNILNGGAHADTGVDVQEFMVAPIGAPSFREALRWGAEVYHSLKSVLKKQGLATGLGDEGGFAPDLRGHQGGARPDHRRRSRRPASSSAPTSRWRSTSPPPSSTPHGTGYSFEKETRTAEQMTQFYAELLDAYPLVSIEDPLAEDDWDGWVDADRPRSATGCRSSATTCSSPTPSGSRRASSAGAANALLVKVNQIGTLTETLDAVALAHNSGYRTMMSHRSGETEDTTIADLAVAVGSGQIKTGAPARSERVAKYNQLLRIEEALGDAARYAGDLAFPRFGVPE